MDSLTGLCLQEIALEGLDGITLETFWMRLRTRVDPVFPLAMDDNSKPLIWQYMTQSDELEFFQLPEPREMPLLRDLVEGTNPITGATTVTKHNEMKLSKEIYPVAYVRDRKNGVTVRGSCATYYQRNDVTDEVRISDGNISLTEAEERWGNRLVMVASQELRWKHMVGLHGDPEEELKDRQYVMLESICRGRHLGDWQWRLAKLMHQNTKTMYYMCKLLMKRGFIKKKIATYQVDDRPHLRAVVLFGSSFKDRLAMPMYEKLWKASSDLLNQHPKKTMTQLALRRALRDQFTDMTISDRTYKRVLGGAVTAKIIIKVRLPYEEVFNKKKETKTNTPSDTLVAAVRLKKTYETYLEEDNVDDDDDDEDKLNDGDPRDNYMVAERTVKTQLVDLIAYNQGSGECTPARSLRHSLMLDYYLCRHLLRKLLADKIISKIMLDEGRQRTAGYCLTVSVDEMEQALNNKEMLEGQKNLLKNGEEGTITPAHSRPGTPSIEHPSTSTSPDGSPGIVIKQEFGPKLYDSDLIIPTISALKCSSKMTSNSMRRRKFILDFMNSNKVVDNVYPIVKALRSEEKRVGNTVICDTKTVKRMINVLCKENLLQTISTVVMSDDGLHTKTVDLISLFGLKPVDSLITSVLQVAKFRFFGSSTTPKKKHRATAGSKPSPENKATPTVTLGAGTTHSRKENKSPVRKKHKDKDKLDEGKEKSSSHKPKKSHHKHKHKSDKASKESAKPEETCGVYSSSEPAYGTRRYFYRQLGYLPKMLRMRMAHMFVWYLVYGPPREPLKTETTEDLDRMMDSSVPSKSGGFGGTCADKEMKKSAQTDAESIDAAAGVSTTDTMTAIPISIRRIDEITLEDQLSEILETESIVEGATASSSVQGIGDVNSGDASHAAPITHVSTASQVHQPSAIHDVEMPAVSESFIPGIHQSQERLVDNEDHSSITRTDQSGAAKDSGSQSGATNDSGSLLGATTDSSSQSAMGKQSLDNATPAKAVEEDVVFLDVEKKFPVYCDTNDWRRYVAPLPFSPNRPHGWCSMRDCLLAMPLSIYLKIISFPLEIKGIRKYLDHPLKQHILMRNMPTDIRQQLLRGRSYLFQFQNVLFKLASTGLVVLANRANLEKEHVSIYVVNKASILDTTTSKPHPKKISDEQRHLRRFYEFKKLRCLEDYWFDLQCICLDTPLGFLKEKGLARKKNPHVTSRYEESLKSIALVVTDVHQPFHVDGIAPGDGRGAGGLDSSFFGHLRRNWNWFHSTPDVNLERYVATWPKRGPFSENGKDGEAEEGERPKVKRLGSIQYRRSNMSKGTSVEVVSVSKKDHKEMKAAVKRKRPTDDSASPPAKTKKQITLEKNSEVKEQKNEAKKKDVAIKKQKVDERRKIRKPWAANGVRNTKTYDDIDESALNKMVKMRVDWSPEEDSMILLFRVASTLLNTKAKSLGAFVPWFVIRDIMHKYIERSNDKTTKSLSKRNRHIFKNEHTLLNYKICLEEAQNDKQLMENVNKLNTDSTDVKECAEEYEKLVLKLQEKFRNSDMSAGALSDLRELRNYAITKLHKPVHRSSDTVLAQRDVKNVNDIHYKLLHSMILSCLSSRDSLLYNNQLLYRLYHQYDEDILGNAFFNLKKLGFCNRNRNQRENPRLRRVIPLAPISTQLSLAYKERFFSKIPEGIMAEMEAFMERLNTSDDSTVLHNESMGGYCAGFLSLYASNMVTVNITLPDQIIVLDSNLLGREEPAANDSDSDSDIEGVNMGGYTTATVKKPSTSFKPALQDLIRIQEERNQLVMEKQRALQKKSAPPQVEKELPSDAIAGGDVSGIVQTEHSYSISHKGVELPTGDGASQRVPDATEAVPDLSTQQDAVNQLDQDGDAGKVIPPEPELNTALVSGEINTAPTGSDNVLPLNMGYNINSQNISHSRWLVLQGHFAPGIVPISSGTNIQDNTLVNSCTLTVRKSYQLNEAGKMIRVCELTPERISGIEGRTRRTLLWEYMHHNDGDFVAFGNACVRNSKVFQRDDLITTKWSDIDAMIQGLKLDWSREDTETLTTVYDCIDQAKVLGVSCKDLLALCDDVGPRESSVKFRDYLQVLVDEQLVLEVGFDLVRLVAAKNASQWLIHSLRLICQPEKIQLSTTDKADTSNPNESQASTSGPTAKRQRTEQSVSDMSADDCIIIVSDVEEVDVEVEEPSVEKKRKRKRKRRTSQRSKDKLNDEPHEVHVYEEMSTNIEGQGEHVTFLGRPWRSIEGYQSDNQLLQCLQHVLLLIFSNPGIQEQAIYKHFKDVLYPVECLELLKMLSELGCITKHVMYKNKPTTVFQTPMQADTTNPAYYYQPTLDGLVKLTECNIAYRT